MAADKVYVANEGADTVSVLDAASFKTLASVRVGKAPHNVQVSPDGKVVWVTNNGEPAQTADASEHKEMAQGSHDAMGKPGAVWAIDTATNAVVAKVPVGMHPAHVVVSPDGRFAYITNGGDNTVSAGSGYDRVTAGSGDDRLVVGDGRNTVDAGSGDNYVSAGCGRDTISG
uniref:YncE family protein n=1 Tax=uncultured Acidovorax sp. TaxID=158751 RepID=UPI0030FC172F